MYSALENLKINLTPEKIEIFNKYINLFQEYNKQVNLISRKETDLLFEKHIYDSLAINLFFEKYETGNKIIDIGTGGGFPAIPIAICFTNKEITALDSTEKKIKFIKQIKENLHIKNINPICKRAEELGDEYRGRYDICVSRAMAELRIILEYSVPFIKTGGYFIAYKSKKYEEEIKSAVDALKMLNSVIIDCIEYKLPLLYDNKRILLIVKKVAETELTYPRKNGVIKKNPL